MFCPKCGAKQPEEKPKFCLKCGASLTRDEGDVPVSNEAAPTSAPAPTPAPEPTPAPAPAPAPEPASSAGTEAKKPLNTKLIAIIAAAVVAIVVIVALVVTSCNKPTETPKPETTSEPEPEPEPEPQVDQPDIDPFLGEWIAQDSTAENMPREWFESAAAQGVYIKLDFKDDGTGVFTMDSGPEDFTWTTSSASTASLKLDSNGSEADIKLEKNSLTLINANGVEMYFVPASEVDMTQNPPTTGPDDIEYDKDKYQLIGNKDVGYMCVPKDWTNRDSDLDPALVSTYAATYWVDASTEFTSPTKSKFDFTKSVQLAHPGGSYKAVASQTAAAYQTEEYGETTTGEITLGGRPGIIVVSSIPKDNVNIATVCLDRDNDDKNCVTITFNAGATTDQAAGEELLLYIHTWVAG